MLSKLFLALRPNPDFFTEIIMNTQFSITPIFRALKGQRVEAQVGGLRKNPIITIRAVGPAHYK
ncbi:hypothetical protein [Carboxylicivirga marina]|uniref:hypothetical protein n=1 Tax=Carboxylicivirga marina TaxID=2800988 RepID=UPI002598F743|nr:hypothetical protein [uncultured Carboxylicivirga sp.]